MSKVFISAGHGGKDPGAVGNGLRESDINLVVALAMRDELVRHGVEVKMSRETDEDDGINEETKECNAYNPDFAISCHTNAGGGDGFEALISWVKNVDESKNLASLIESEVISLGQNSRGLKSRKNSSGKADYYGFIRQCNCMAIILEGAFIDTKKDIEFIDTVEEQRTLGKAYAHGVLKYLGIDIKEEATEETTKDGIIYKVQVGAFKVRENAERQLQAIRNKGIDGMIVEVKE